MEKVNFIMNKNEIFFIPKYMIVPLGITGIWNTIVYLGSRLLLGEIERVNSELAIDKLIPFLPFTASIYIGCYIFWIVNYILAIRQSKEEAMHFIAADMFSKMVCLICFLTIHTTIARPLILGDGFWEDVIRIIYKVDSPDNLFPSIHCLVSWLSYIAVRNNEKISKGYRMFSKIFAILVCVSTVTTKQHVVIDIIAGVTLAEVSYFVVQFRIVKIFSSIFNRINKIFGIY